MKKIFGHMSLMQKNNNIYWLMENIEPHVCIKLKSLFTYIRKSSTSPFLFHFNDETSSDLFWFLQRYPMSISKKDYDILKASHFSYVKKINKIENILLPTYQCKPISVKNGMSLRNYQSQVVETIKIVNRLLVADDIGLGKTYCGIGAMTCDDAKLPCLVVCQTHLPKQWLDAIEGFSDLKIHIVKTRKMYNLPEADVYIMKYSTLSGWVDLFSQRFFKTIIFDEIQELRHGNDTDKGKSAKILSDNAERVMGLSATPIYNFGDEIWNIANIIKDNVLGSKDDFCREWTNNGKVVSNPEALGTYLREILFLIRRTRDEVGRELQPVNTITQTVDYDDTIVKDMEKLLKQLAHKVVHGNALESRQASFELDIHARQTTGISKAESVATYVKMLLDNNEKVLLGGWHREVYNIWSKQLKDYNPVMYTGTETGVQKEKAREAFIKGDSNLLIMSLRSGIGVDGLQHVCSTVVHGELDWSQCVHQQFTGRVDRDGQKRQVCSFYLHANFGSDPILLDLLGLKASQLHGIMNPDTKPQLIQQNDINRFKALAKKFL